MASQDLLEALLAEEPPALQQVQSPEQEKRPTLVEGSFHHVKVTLNEDQKYSRDGRKNTSK